MSGKRVYLAEVKQNKGGIGGMTRTNIAAMAQFSQGRLLIPSSVGRVNITVRSVRNPGASIVIQASFPGRFPGMLVEVLPIPYHG